VMYDMSRSKFNYDYILIIKDYKIKAWILR
jgi:hypothetical protein